MVEKEKTETICFHSLGRFLCYLQQHLVEVQIEPDELTKLQERPELPLALVLRLPPEDVFNSPGRNPPVRFFTFIL